MLDVAVYAAVGNKPVQVQFFAVRFHVVHYAQQFFVSEKFPVADFFRDLREILVYDAPRADVQMSHFGIAHLSVGKPYGHPARAERRGGIFFFQSGYVLASVRPHGVAFVFRVESVAVHDDDSIRCFHCRFVLCCARAIGGATLCRLLRFRRGRGRTLIYRSLRSLRNRWLSKKRRRSVRRRFLPAP